MIESIKPDYDFIIHCIHCPTQFALKFVFFCELSSDVHVIPANMKENCTAEHPNFTMECDNRFETLG